MAGTLIDQVIGHYRIITKIGEGGMGVVYLAEHEILGRKVVIKVLHPELARRKEVIQRFFNEAKAPNTVGHPDLVEIYDVGTTESGSAYLVMEFLRGRSLGQVIEEDGFVDEVTLRALGYRIARALGAAHARGIIHRDIKPENIFVVPDPGRPDRARVKILDFGIAKLREEDMAANVKTQAGTVLGTPAYMSPEQCQGLAALDARSDIYSLGAVLYELLTGRPPFDATSLGSLITKHLTEEPAPIRETNQRVTPELQAVVLKCLAKAPEDRFQTMEELADALALEAPTQVDAEEEEAAPPLQVAGVSGVSKTDSGPGLPLQAAMAGGVFANTQGPPSTLSASAGELSQTPSRPGTVRRRVLTSGVISAVAVVVIGLSFGIGLSLRFGGGDETEADSEEMEAAEPADKKDKKDKKEADEEAPAARPAAATVTEASSAEKRERSVRVESEPVGAELRDAVSGEFLGETPHSFTLRPDELPRRLDIVHPGHETKSLELTADTPEVVRVSLVSLPATARPAVKAKPRKKKPRPKVKKPTGPKAID